MKDKDVCIAFVEILIIEEFTGVFFYVFRSFLRS